MMDKRDFKAFCNSRICIANDLRHAFHSYLIQALTAILQVKASEGKPNMVYLIDYKLINNPSTDDEFYKKLSRVRYDSDNYADIEVHYRPYAETADKNAEDMCSVYHISDDEIYSILQDTTDKDRIAFMKDEEFDEYNTNRLKE